MSMPEQVPAPALVIAPPSTHRPKYHTMGHIPKDGMAFNPMRDWPRNEPCWCSSGRKAKKCCLLTVKQCIPIKEAVALDKCMRMPRGLAVIRAVYLDKAKAAGDLPPDHVEAPQP